MGNCEGSSSRNEVKRWVNSIHHTCEIVFSFTSRVFVFFIFFPTQHIVCNFGRTFFVIFIFHYLNAYFAYWASFSFAKKVETRFIPAYSTVFVSIRWLVSKRVLFYPEVKKNGCFPGHDEIAEEKEREERRDGDPECFESCVAYLCVS